MDNLHFTPTPVDTPDQGIDEPGPTTFGCPACVHVHWRWSSVLNSDTIPRPPGIDVDFENNKGAPFLPPNPTQDVDVAIETSGTVHPNNSTLVKDLVSSTNSLLPSQVIKEHTQPVFWYIATGHKSSDEFFLHGGGFGTFYANKVIVPGPGAGPVSLNIEHSRPLSYTIDKLRLDSDSSANPKNPVPSLVQASISGKLPDNRDDIDVTFDPNISSIFWGPKTIDMKITVTLEDSTLAPKFKWQRVFEFSVPSSQEP